MYGETEPQQSAKIAENQPLPRVSHDKYDGKFSSPPAPKSKRALRCRYRKRNGFLI